MMCRLAAILAVLTLFLPANAQNAPAAQPLYGLPRMAKFADLPALRDAQIVEKTGSSDGKQPAVIEAAGPGCLTRLQIIHPSGTLTISLDGEAKPRISGDTQKFFAGKIPPFAASLVLLRKTESVSNFPIPFQKSCRIELKGSGAFTYQATFERYPDKTNLRTFTPKLTDSESDALDRIEDQETHLGDDPKPPGTGTRTINGAGILAPGQAKTFATLLGPAVVNRLKIKFAPLDRHTLRQTLLRVTWDGAASPAIDAPIGDFFAAGFAANAYKSLPMTVSDDGFLCFLPMPFAKSARFEIVNTGAKPVQLEAFHVEYQPMTRFPTNYGCLNAQFRRGQISADKPLVMLETQGRGHWLGAAIAVQNPPKRLPNVGEIAVRVNGEAAPVMQAGIGEFFDTEISEEHDTPDFAFTGCTARRDDLARYGGYRWLLSDAVPFAKAIAVTLSQNTPVPADIAATAFWYQDAPTHANANIEPALLSPMVYTLADVLEAETQAWEGAAAVRSADSLLAEASGGKVEAIGKTGATWTYAAERKGSYVFKFAMLLQPDCAKKVRFTVDGDRADGWNDQDLADYTNVAAGGLWIVDMELDLKAGKHTFQLAAEKGDFVYLDYIKITPPTESENKNNE